MDQQVPDFIPNPRERFREALAAEGLIEELFEAITRQLNGKGLILKRGTVVDSTIIESSGRPLSEDKREVLQANPSARRFNL